MNNKLTWRKAHSIFRVVWPILLALVIIAATWAAFATTVQSNTRRIEILEERMDILVDIQVDIMQVKTDVAWLKEWARNNGRTP